MYAWGGETRKVSVTAGGSTTHTLYNAADREWRAWGSGANPVEYGYDSLGRRTSMRTWQTGTFTGDDWPNPSGGDTTSWTFDPATGLLNRKTAADTTHTDYTYTTLGLPATRTSARNVVTTYAYYDGSTTSVGDVSHRTHELRAVTYANDGGLTSPLSYTYKRSGAPYQISDAAGTRTFAYRSDGQIDTESLDWFYTWRTLTRTYDTTVAGRPNGYSFNGNVTVTTTLGFDGATGRVNTITGALNSTSVPFTLGYNTPGTDWAGTITAGSFSRTQTLHPNRNVLDRIETKWDAIVKGDFDSWFTLATEPRGWRTEESRSGEVVQIGAHYQTVRYGPRGEITESNNSIDANRNTGFGYDLAGNRTDMGEFGFGSTYYYPTSTNALTSIGGSRGEPQVFDTDGNMTQDGTWTYAYDGENRLKSMSRSGQTLTFTYDYLGRRIRKEVAGADAKDRKYVWNGWTLVAETISDGCTVQFSFVRGPDFSSAQGSAGGAGGLLGIFSPGFAFNYAVPDSLGNIVGYLNGGGNVSAKYEYTAFGMIRQQVANDLPFGYSTQYTDRETGLVYYGLRYYNPTHGRFINRDPIEEAGGNNLYTFVGNNPANRWDVLGAWWCYYDYFWEQYICIPDPWDIGGSDDDGSDVVIYDPRPSPFTKAPEGPSASASGR